MTKNKIYSPEILNALQECLSKGRLLIKEPMCEHTSFAIGGPADLFVLVTDMAEATALMQIIHAYAIPYTIIGNGSNLLVRDAGIRGVVLKMDKTSATVSRKGNTLVANAGMVLADLCRHALALSLSGLEFAIGIPGSVGGAVFMNAGAYDGEMSQVVKSVTAISPAGEIRRFDSSEMEFSYRHSIFQRNGYWICEIEFALLPGVQEAMTAQMQELTRRREEKQPLDMPSAGSTFRRPPGHFVGTMIEASGLKGFACGGAAVSTKHAGFVINQGGATAADVLELIAKIQAVIKEKYQVDLQTEMRIIGE